MNGKLQGSVNADGTACLWIQNGATVTGIVWPNGYYADGYPLTIRSADGSAMGTVGETVSLGGGLGQDPRVAPVLGCRQASQAWIVSEVVSSK